MSNPIPPEGTMRLNGKLVDEITPADLQQLVDDRRPEDPYLDY
jgi:hypothetical protein